MAEIDGDDVRNFRNTKRLAWTTIAVLSALLVVVSFLAAYSNAKRREAEEKTRASTAQTLALRARALLAERRIDKALLLSAHSVRLNPSPENIGTLKECIRFPKLPINCLQVGPNFARAARFSRDGNFIVATMNDGSFMFWSTATLQPTNLNSTRQQAAHAIALDLVIGIPWSERYDASTVWNLVAQQHFGSFIAGNLPKHIWYNRDGSLAAIGDIQGGPLMIWNLRTGHSLRILSTNHHYLRCAAFSSDSRLLATGAGQFPEGEFNTTLMWSAVTGELLAPPLVAGKGQVDSVAFSPDGKLLASGSLRGLTLWDVTSGSKASPALETNDGDVWTLAFSPDGRMMASGSWDNTIRLYDVSTRKQIGDGFTAHKGGVWSVDFSSDGHHLVSVGYNGEAILWAVPSLIATNGRPYERFTPDGKIFASGHNDVLLADAETGKPVTRTLATRLNGQWGLAFSPDGKLFAAGNPDGPVLIWDVQTLRRIGDPLIDHGPVYGLAFSPDSRVLAIGSWDRTIRFWDIVARRFEGTPLTGHRDGIYSVAFSHDAKSLASGGWDRTARLWNLVTRTNIGSALTDHDAAVKSVTFSPDDQMLASAGEDGTVIVWDVGTQQPLKSPFGGLRRNQSMERVEFSPDGSKLRCTGSDGSVLEWNLSFGASEKAQTEKCHVGWINVAREMANRELSKTEVEEAFDKLELKLYAPLWRERR